MRHGWKTRIEERRYFEEKKEEREERIQMLKILRAKAQADLDVHWDQLNRGSMWQNETH